MSRVHIQTATTYSYSWYSPCLLKGGSAFCSSASLLRRAPMSEEGSAGKATGDAASRLVPKKAVPAERPVVPKLALMSLSPSPPPPAAPKLPYQGPPNAAEWVDAVYERHRPERESLPRVASGYPTTEDAVNEFGRRTAQQRTAALGVASSSSSKSGPPPVLLSQAMEAQQTYHREVGAAFQSGFEPQRHSTYVLGRPVQVGPMSIT